MLYFLSGNQSPDKSLFEKFGLEYAFEDLPFDVGQVKPKQGPDGQSGFVVSCSGHPPDYNPNNQVWFKHPLGAHFGWTKSSPPKPANLQRKNMLQGSLVKLIDGNDWIIPVAYSWVLEEQKVRFTEEFARTLEFVNGQWTPSKVVPAQEAFASIGKIVFDAWRNRVGSQFAIANATDLCCKTICLNYRLSAVEVGALGLLTNASNYAWMILRTVIDMDGYLDLQKKVFGDQNTSSGSEAGTLATG